MSPVGARRDCGRVPTGRVDETRVRYAGTEWECRLVEGALDGNPEMPTADWGADRLRAWVDGVAARVVGGRYAKSRRGYRKQPRQKSKSPKGSHTATARVIEQRRINRQ